MTYLCLVYFEPGIFDRMSDDEKRALDRDSLAYDRELERRGNYIRAEALDATSAAVTVQVRAGKVSTTDGPFAETKEILGGFILINAASRDEAVDIAAGIPLAKYGKIEVRPVYDFSGA